MQTTPIFLPGKFQEQRSLVGYSPWDCKRVRYDLATQQQQKQQDFPRDCRAITGICDTFLQFIVYHVQCNNFLQCCPLQYSCLENPMCGGAWQAAVHGVTKSRTRLNDFTFTYHFYALEKEMTTHSSVLAGESQGWGSLVSCRLWGHAELNMTEMTQQQPSK